jgi:hypothetical protein
MASGDTLFKFFPADSEPPAADFPEPTEITAATGYRDTLNYDDTTAEKTVFSDDMPSAYAGTTGVTIRFKGTMEGANTGTKGITLGVSFERVTIGDALGAGGSDFAAANNTTITVDNTAGNEFEGTVTFTDGVDMDSVVAYDAFRLEVERLPSDGGDDAVGDFRLLSVIGKET